MAEQQSSDVPCPFCACLCDDLQITVVDQRVVSIRHGCPIAEANFLAPPGERLLDCKIAGRVADRDAAIDHAASLLTQARAPLVYGLTGVSCEAQRLAVEIAERIGAVLDVPGGRPSLAALQSVGANSCTLGEIRQRADLIVIWDCDPRSSHPRFFERHVSDTAQIARVDAGATETGAITLLALLRNVALDQRAIGQQTGVAVEVWRELLERMRGAQYGVVLHASSDDSPAARRMIESLHRLIRELNNATRFVCQELPPAGNDLGAENVIAWRTGYAPPVDFLRQFPRYLGGADAAPKMLGRGEFDAALVIGADPLGSQSPAAQIVWRQVPTVAIDCRETLTASAANVFLPIALPGVESGGTMFRMDGVPLELRPVLAPRHPSDREMLQALSRAIRDQQIHSNS